MSFFSSIGMSLNGILTSTSTLSLVIGFSLKLTSPLRDDDNFSAVCVISLIFDKSVVYAKPQAPLFNTLILAPKFIPVLISSTFPSFINIEVLSPFPNLMSMYSTRGLVFAIIFSNKFIYSSISSPKKIYTLLV